MLEDALQRFQAVAALHTADRNAAVGLAEAIVQHADGDGDLVADFARGLRAESGGGAAGARHARRQPKAELPAGERLADSAAEEPVVIRPPERFQVAGMDAGKIGRVQVTGLRQRLAVNFALALPDGLL